MLRKKIGLFVIVDNFDRKLNIYLLTAKNSIYSNNKISTEL